MTNNSKQKEGGYALKSVILRTAVTTLLAAILLLSVVFTVMCMAFPGFTADTLSGMGNQTLSYQLYKRDYDKDQDDLNKLSKLVDLSIVLSERKGGYPDESIGFINKLLTHKDFAAYAKARNTRDIQAAPVTLKAYYADYKNYLETALVSGYYLSGKSDMAEDRAAADFEVFYNAFSAEADLQTAALILPSRSFSAVSSKIFGEIGLKETADKNAVCSSFSVNKVAFFADLTAGFAYSPAGGNIKSCAQKIVAVIEANRTSQNEQIVFRTAVLALWLLNTSGDMCLLTGAIAAQTGQSYTDEALSERTFWKGLYDGVSSGQNSYVSLISHYEELIG